jgi:hypothetical protein
MMPSAVPPPDSGPGEEIFRPYSVGLCYASVCTNLDDVTATWRLNRDHPTGVGPWKIADEPFVSGHPNPTPCPTSPGRHILFSC